ncbi:MAG: demethoxyubiquinone hydroxylase family protein [Rickettsiales bacterium]
MPHTNKINEMIRVNHAGEMGAKVIYDGQILALKLKKDYETLKIVEEMKLQEIKHFEYFNNQIKQQKIRPTLMQPIWLAGGFALGFMTAIIDKKSAMTCTTAVEEIIDEHYQQQISELEFIEKNNPNKNQKSELEDLKSKIIKFRDEEIEHKDTAFEHNAQEFVAFEPLSKFIKLTTKMAIAISKKI